MRVVTLDSDNNRNLTNRLAGSDIPCRAVEEEAILSAVADARAQADMVLIDVAGALARGMLYAVHRADAVVIPCKPDRNDVIEAARTQDVIRQAEAMKGQAIPHAVVLTQVNRRAQAADVARGQLDSLGVPRLPVEMPLRTAYADASFTGVPIGTTAVRDDLAEIAAAVLALGG